MKRQILIAITFLAGCVAGGMSSQMIAPPARAGAPVTRWEYFCVHNSDDAAESMANLNAAGARGWELATAAGFGGHMSPTTMFCLKRPL